MAKHWIQTHTGRKFDPFTAGPSDIDPRDIARALSHVCRYGGHVDRFYSVAEHSVLLAREVYRRGGTLDQVRWALMHDATEAYLGDVCRPLKHRPEWAFYRQIEADLMARAIAPRFRLVGAEPEIVRQLDTEILGTEARALKSPLHPDWATDSPMGQLAPDWADTEVGSYSPLAAERLFLSRFHNLFPDG